MPSSIGSMNTLSINLDGLHPGAVAASVVVDNTSNLFDSVQCYLKLVPGAIRPGGYFVVGLLASVDNVTFTDSSADEVIISSADGNLQKTVANLHYFVLDSLPLYYKIYVHNRSGDALSANPGDNTLSYCGVKN